MANGRSMLRYVRVNGRLLGSLFRGRCAHAVNCYEARGLVAVKSRMIEALIVYGRFRVG